MTSPDGAVPEGSLAPGLFAVAQAQQEQDVKDQITSQPIDSWSIAQHAWRAACQRPRSSIADLEDGQNALKGRMDLLRGITAHGTSVMSKNWALDVLSVWKVLPFDLQLGPASRVAVTEDALVLKGGGLWRIDAHAAVSGYTIGLGFRINPVTGFFESYNMFREIKPGYMIEIRDSAGNLLSARTFDATPEAFYTEYGAPGQGLTGPYSTHFSMPIVLDRPDDTTDDPDAWVYVRLLLRVEPSPSGVLSDVLATIHGGTQMSALTASRWSVDVEHLAYEPTVPDGGEL